MKLYKLDYNDNIIELTIIKSTPKILTYIEPDMTYPYKIRKSVIGTVSQKDVYSQIATSPQELKKLISMFFDLCIEAIEEDKKSLLAKLDNY